MPRISQRRYKMSNAFGHWRSLVTSKFLWVTVWGKKKSWTSRDCMKHWRSNEEIETSGSSFIRIFNKYFLSTSIYWVLRHCAGLIHEGGCGFLLQLTYSPCICLPASPTSHPENAPKWGSTWCTTMRHIKLPGDSNSFAGSHPGC